MSLKFEVYCDYQSVSRRALGVCLLHHVSVVLVNYYICHNYVGVAMSWRLTRRQLRVRLVAIFVYAVVSGFLVFYMSFVYDDFDDNDDDNRPNFASDKLDGSVIINHINGGHSRGLQCIGFC